MSDTEEVFELAAKLNKEIGEVIRAALKSGNYDAEIIRYFLTPLITIEANRKHASINIQGEISFNL